MSSGEPVVENLPMQMSHRDVTRLLRLLQNSGVSANDLDHLIENEQDAVQITDLIKRFARSAD